MTDASKLIEKARSGVISIVFYIDGIPISSGSGFLYKNHLISNNHVFNPDGQTLPSNTIVGFRFGDSSQYANDDFRVPYTALQVKAGSTEDSHDYIVHNIPLGVDVSKRHMFELDNELAHEGQEVMLLGYPFSSKFMTSHVGHISAIYENKGVKTLQLDASVNSGNSGGPLLDLESGKVIGIVTRKLTGLSEQFDILISSFDDNIRALEKIKGHFQIGELDPMAVLQVSQRQMQHLSNEIKKSSNVGIGYAFSTMLLENEDL